jgi:hypothetical protein
MLDRLDDQLLGSSRLRACLSDVVAVAIELARGSAVCGGGKDDADALGGPMTWRKVSFRNVLASLRASFVTCWVSAADSDYF